MGGKISENDLTPKLVRYLPQTYLESIEEKSYRLETDYNRSTPMTQSIVLSATKPQSVRKTPTSNLKLNKGNLWNLPFKNLESSSIKRSSKGLSTTKRRPFDRVDTNSIHCVSTSTIVD